MNKLTLVGGSTGAVSDKLVLVRSGVLDELVVLVGKELAPGMVVGVECASGSASGMTLGSTVWRIAS